MGGPESRLTSVSTMGAGVPSVRALGIANAGRGRALEGGGIVITGSGAGGGGTYFFAVPFDKLVVPVCPEAKLRKLVKNMLYTGVAAHLLGIDMAEIEKALRKQFGKRKAKAADMNWGACKAGFDYAAEHFQALEDVAEHPVEFVDVALVLHQRGARQIIEILDAARREIGLQRLHQRQILAQRHRHAGGFQLGEEIDEHAR